jgi:hypothetical protein
VNILVGPNNSGKSTIIGALRALSVALRRARSRKSEWVPSSGGQRLGHWIDIGSLPISIENVHTDYADSASWVDFRLSNGNRLTLYFPVEGGCTLAGDAHGAVIRDTTSFRRAFPLTVAVVPILGPVEHEEPLLDFVTVHRNLETHRASRHFRNFWWYNNEGFDDFAERIRTTWPGLDIQLPELVGSQQNTLVMFCLEKRMTRELYWAGFGFQIWCQLLTHIARSGEDSLLVIDEPEVYLHPDVQRQLLGILRAAGPDVLIATHSTEIMGEADPSEILLVDKEKRSAERVRDIAGVQTALDAIGSIQNITLTQLARTQRLVFVEDDGDIRILRRFAGRLGLSSLSTGLGYTPLPSGGFGAWDRIRTLAWGFRETFRSPIKVGAIFDRDYRSEEETESILAELQQQLALAHIVKRKELENYLLVVAPLERAVAAQVADRALRSGADQSVDLNISDLLEAITAEVKAEAQAQYVAKRIEFLRRDRRDAATIATETLAWFEQEWSELETRLALVPGKTVLRSLRTRIQDHYGIALSDYRIIDSFQPSDIDPDLIELLTKMDAFRT